MRLLRSISFLTFLTLSLVVFLVLNLSSNYSYGEDREKEKETGMMTTESTVSHVLRRLQRWGRVVGSGPKTSGAFPKNDCMYLGQPICCSALEDTEKKIKHHPGRHCITKKEYLPSPYEIKQLEKAEELAKITNFQERQTKYIDFLELPEEVESAKKWLARIAQRQPGLPLEENDIDREYLSRFKVTRKCGSIETSWFEYIEPLSVHARHPFALGNCGVPGGRKVYSTLGLGRPPSIVSIDYILLQTIRDPNGNHSIHSPSHHNPYPNSFLLDAGTSRFDSSLAWFVCAYQQLGHVFDGIFGWEYTLLEPNDFWQHVPPRYLPIYRFFNAPVAANVSVHHSPLHIIKQSALPEDFVAFKLDIDTPSIEIPIAMSLLNDPVLHTLVDEYFFEFHFRCEVMMWCGWGDNIAEKEGDMELNRPTVMNYFRDIRRLGIRAHIWP